MLAEDSDEFRRLLAMTLRRDGFDVAEARNGVELARRVAASEQETGDQFDLIISDIRMPLMTGLDAISAVRGSDWSIPVILITAFGDEDTQSEATRLGAGAVFSKPFRLGDLRMAARRFARG